MPDPGLTAVSLDRRLRACIYGAVLLAYLASAGADPLRGFQLALFGAAAAWSLAAEQRFQRLFFAPALKVGLIVSGAAVFIVFVALRPPRGPEAFAGVISRFLFWNAVVFVLSRAKTEYDIWTLAIVTLSLFMIAGAFVQPPWFLPLLAGSVALALAAFQRLPVAGSSGPRRGAWRSLGIQGMIAIEVAALLFVLFPRQMFAGSGRSLEGPAVATETPAPSPSPEAETRSGLPRTPGRLPAGSFAGIKNDPTPFLDLQIRLEEGGEPRRLDETVYLRQEVYDRYRDGAWTSDLAPVLLGDAADGAEDGRIRRPSAPASGGRPLHQRIRFRPQAGQALLAIAEPLYLGVPAASYDPRGIFFARPPVPGEYRAISLAPDRPAAERVGRVLHVPVADASLLLLPPGLDRLRAVARQVATGTTPYERAESIRLHLAGRDFRYLLAPRPPPAGRDPVDHFVAEGREGFCVQFAGAMALMARSAGLPARVATGLMLQHDSYDEESASYVGRHSDAHAWVEIWFGPDHGWVIFDPTPAAARPEVNEGPAVATGDKPGEGDGTAAGGRWDRFLFDYDSGLQGSLFRGLGSAVAWTGRAVASPAGLVILAAAAFLGITAWLLLPRPQRRRIRQALSRFRAGSSVRFYADFLWILSTRGLRKAPGMTPSEFAALARQRAPADIVDSITDAFQRVRYGGRTLARSERESLRRDLRRLEAEPSRP